MAGTQGRFEWGSSDLAAQYHHISFHPIKLTDVRHMPPVFEPKTMEKIQTRLIVSKDKRNERSKAKFW